MNNLRPDLKERYDRAVGKTNGMSNRYYLRAQALDIAKRVVMYKVEYLDHGFLLGIPIGSVGVYEEIIAELNGFPCPVFVESRLLPGRAMLHVSTIDDPPKAVSQESNADCLRRMF